MSINASANAGRPKRQGVNGEMGENNKWTAKFPKRGSVGWFRSAVIEDGVIVEISGGAPGVSQVVYMGDEVLPKNEFIKQNGPGEFYGPLQPPE